MKNAITAVGTNDSEMGAQLTEQYHKAINAMPEVMKFGAMVIILEEKLDHGDPVSGGRGKEGGLREWMRVHAPDVPRGNALRFRDVVKGIMEDYPSLVGAKVAKQFTLPDLVTADPEKLPAAVVKKRDALFDFVAGTSQKSWLDKFRPAKLKGGRRNGKEKKLTPAQEEAIFLAAAREDFASAFAKLDTLVMNGHWQAPSIVDAEIESAIVVAEKFAEQATAWLKLPQKKRTRPTFGNHEAEAVAGGVE